ncbi:hydrolase glyoxylase [Bacillus sp. M6-12]|uniref:MBL fold metallo-hydrolase n=1 Tax=Bacillus sp. M6-12 TaxID=2054166 RepID=UPI000C755C6A|nr:MBL fold metallo-hydrolase [Bacillus sp. M6-12]PLS17548.1 hydrolase glyoxylase [Bacillus sp. M6-12]
MIQYQNNILTVFQSELYMTTSALVETEAAMFLTDPNWLPSEVEEIRQYVEARRNGRNLYLIFTHSDFDHIIGYGAFPDAKVIASEEFANLEDKQQVIEQVIKFDQGRYLTRSYDHDYPDVDITVAADGEAIELDGVSLTFYKAPGHTADGIYTVISQYGILLAGDYLSDVEFPFIYDSWEAYMDTMKKTITILEKDNILILVPGHGNTADTKNEIRDRVEFSIQYLQSLTQEGQDIEEVLKNKYRFYEGLKNVHEHNKKQVAGKTE